MALVSREDDLKDVAERLKYGRRLHGKSFDCDRVDAYNKSNRTNVHDKETLSRLLENEEKLRLLYTR